MHLLGVILLTTSVALTQSGISYPGTYYCGPGNTAKGDKKADLEEVDNCCKVHDECPVRIKRGETNYGLRNNGWFTRSSCDCDAALRECLSAVQSRHARWIRFLFDTSGPTKCIKINSDFENGTTYEFVDSD